MNVYYVMFKWRDFYEDEHFETKEFTSLYKALKFKNKIEKETEKLIRRYGRQGIYHPFYDISIVGGRTQNGR